MSDGGSDLPQTSWIKIHRSIMDSSMWADDWLVRLWLWCLLKANYSDCKWRGITVLRGQFITGRSSAADELGVSPSKWYRGIQELAAQDRIKIDANSSWTRITVCNYRTYQNAPDESRTASEQRLNTSIEGKNIYPSLSPKSQPQEEGTAVLRTWTYPANCPEAVCRAIDLWQEHLKAKDGRVDSDIKLTMAYAHAKSAGWDEAKLIKSIHFSIAKGARNWLDPANDYDQPRAARAPRGSNHKKSTF